MVGVTERHVWRLLSAYRKESETAGNQRRNPRRPRIATLKELAEHVVALLTRTRYPDVNHTLLTELLAEREGIDLGRQTLRRILLAARLIFRPASSSRIATGN